ncbi:unnamed protein product [Adineta ricciae]|uniref:Uncharacterized protein n=1 Tax=Adineta ricciae TaxID=249248 RepID=A0A815HAE6_ADIRI|nr:unnamed protein product [Adineta ricciae]CAF1483699.1 unnamed protein product [Adineta ricciae]
MRRNPFSLILPTKRTNSFSSLNSNRSYHFIRSAEDHLMNESFYDDSISLKRRKSSIHCAHYIVIEYSHPTNSTRSNQQFIHAGNCLESSNKKAYSLSIGETLIHLSARLGHEYILRRLIEETPYGTRLTNGKGQTPLLCAIQCSHYSTAMFLMDIDPSTITVCDHNLNSVFHYATYLCNHIVLSRAMILIKRLNSPHLKTQVLLRLIEKNKVGKNPFLISVEKGNIRCNRLFFSNENLLKKNSLDISIFLNNESVCCAIDNDRIDLMAFWLSDMKRLEILLEILIHNSFNLFEYSIENEKISFIRLFLSQEFSFEKHFLKEKYKKFLNNFNLIDRLTPLQRLLKKENLYDLIPSLLDHFVIENNGADLSIIDDCLFLCPFSNQCLFGHEKSSWSKQSWYNEHPLNQINQILIKSIYDHPIIRLCIDLKYSLFGNILYLIITFGQIFYVMLYTFILLFSPTRSIDQFNYYTLINDTCQQFCFKLINHPNYFQENYNQFYLRLFRYILVFISILTLFKEAFQLIKEKNKYFKKIFLNFLEIHMYISAIIYGIDFNECTHQTGIRCHFQWEIGSIGLLSVWFSLLFVFMKGMQCGKHGLLFLTVLFTFIKFIIYYSFIWIGFYLVFYLLMKDLSPQFHSFYLIPKLLVMFIGEFDFDETFFPNQIPIKGAEGALFIYSIFILTMFIVMSNIMAGLAVADVKEFRLNAKREHLRSRIETILQVQSNFGFLCEICSKMTLKYLNNKYLNKYLFKSDLSRLEFAEKSYEHFGITIHTGLIQANHLKNREKFLKKSFLDEKNLFMKNQNQFKEYFEESILKIHNQLKTIHLQLKTDIQDLKTHVDQILSNH